MKKLNLFIIMMLVPSFVQASSAPVVAITSPDVLSAPSAGSSITISATASEANETISSVTFYNGSTLLGQSIRSPYSFTWDQVPAGTYVLTAVATDNYQVSTRSNPITLTVKPASPIVDIISPDDETTFTAGSNISISATASEFNGTVSTVSFYDGSTLLGQSSKSPYNYTWANVSAGDHSLTAVATDINNISTTSSPITVTATSLPVIAITSPHNGSSFTAGSSITITASTPQKNGGIREVFFYDNIYFLGSSTISPYKYSWTNVPIGTYALTIEETDSNGGTLVSAPVNITVNPADNMITIPASGPQKEDKIKA